MSKTTEWCQDKDPHDEHDWTDRRDYDHRCDGTPPMPGPNSGYGFIPEGVTCRATLHDTNDTQGFTPWRVGRKLGRTIYTIPTITAPAEQLLGLMETKGIAERVVRLHNEAIGFKSDV